MEGAEERVFQEGRENHSLLASAVGLSSSSENPLFEDAFLKGGFDFKSAEKGWQEFAQAVHESDSQTRESPSHSHTFFLAAARNAELVATFRVLQWIELMSENSLVEVKRECGEALPAPCPTRAQLALRVSDSLRTEPGGPEWTRGFAVN